MTLALKLQFSNIYKCQQYRWFFTFQGKWYCDFTLDFLGKSTGKLCKGIVTHPTKESKYSCNEGSA